MQTTPEKKFFSCGERTYTLVMGRRWYLEHYVWVSSEVRVRKREYGYINRIKCLKAREAAAMELMRRLDAQHERPLQKGASMLERALHEARPLFRYKTFMSYLSRVKYWRAYVGNGRDEAATPEQARGFITYLASCRANATVRSYQRTLHGLYERAGVPVANNPFHGIKTAAPGSMSLKPFTQAQSAAILRRAGDELRMAILLMFYCFIRPGEMRRLRVEDFDLERRIIELRSEISKNKKTQPVSIPDALLLVLKEYLAERSAGLLITHPKTGEMVGPGWLYVQHKRILKALGIQGRFSLYSWKHTGVVRAVQAGVNLKELQLQLRHHSLDMVNEYLKDLGVIDSKDLRSRFPAILPPIPVSENLLP